MQQLRFINVGWHVTGAGIARMVLAFTPNDVTTTAGGLTPAAQTIGTYRATVASVPVATNWTLIITAVMIVLCAGLFFGRKAIRN
jgi:hypothetical protein